MSNIYFATTGAMPSTASTSTATVSTGATMKTLLQVATPSTRSIRVKEWGVSFDGSAAATPGKVELIDTNNPASVTAYAAADVYKFNYPSDEATLMTLGASASGFNASSEGNPSSNRVLDLQLIAPTNQYLKQFPLGTEPVVGTSRFLRVRATFGASVNAYAYVNWEE